MASFIPSPADDRKKQNDGQFTGESVQALLSKLVAGLAKLSKESNSFIEAPIDLTDAERFILAETHDGRSEELRNKLFHEGIDYRATNDVFAAQNALLHRFLLALNDAPPKFPSTQGGRKKAAPKKTERPEVSPLAAVAVQCALPLFFLVLKNQWRSSGTAAAAASPTSMIARTVLREAAKAFKMMKPLSLFGPETSFSAVTLDSIRQVYSFLKSIIAMKQGPSDEDKALAANVFVQIASQRATLSDLIATVECFLESDPSLSIDCDSIDALVGQFKAHIEKLSEKSDKPEAQHLLDFANSILEASRSGSSSSSSSSGSGSGSQKVPLVSVAAVVVAYCGYIAGFFLPRSDDKKDGSGSGSSSSSSGPGVAYVCGGNSYGEAGGYAGAPSNVSSLEENSHFTQLRPKQICPASNFTTVLTEDGEVYVVGKGDYGRLGTGSSTNVQTLTKLSEFGGSGPKIVLLASSRGSYGSSIALDDTNKIWTWGDGDFGKLGHGDTTQQPRPKRLAFFDDKPPAVAISCGFKHTAVVLEDGKVYTWGSGDYGRLGHGDGSQQISPKLVEGLAGHNMVDVV